MEVHRYLVKTLGIAVYCGVGKDYKFAIKEEEENKKQKGALNLFMDQLPVKSSSTNRIRSKLEWHAAREGSQREILH